MSVWPAKPFTKSVFIFGSSLAFAFYSPTARAADAEAVSNGSISTVTAGGFQPALAGLRGVVITSPVTSLSLANQPTFNLYASRITLPALVVWHQEDHCSFSPAMHPRGRSGEADSAAQSGDGRYLG